jgi:hypothetical protein
MNYKLAGENFQIWNNNTQIHLRDFDKDKNNQAHCPSAKRI